MAYPLEPDRDEMRAIADRAMTFVIDFISALPDAPASDLDGYEDALRRVSGPVPEAGSSFDELVEQVALGPAKAFNPASLGYLAFIPGGGLFAAAVADFM